MNASSAPVDRPSAGAKTWAWAAAALLVSLLAITSQSLWIDESLTAAKAVEPHFSGWWQAMLAGKASDLQMPLYMLYVWGFAKVFGVSEWALREANIPWFVGGVAVCSRSFQLSSLPKGNSSQRRFLLAAVILFSPFAWYYLDEARPYTMQLGSSLVILGALWRLVQNESFAAGGERMWLAIFCFGIVALSGSSLLGMIWAGAACLGAGLIFSWQQLVELARKQWLILAVAMICLSGLGVYYLWTLKVGARASDVGRTDARNIVFIAYELLGFGGLGPGRLEIRDSGSRVFAAYAIPLALYAVLVADIFIQGLGQVFQCQSRKLIFGFAVMVGSPVVVILGAGWAQHFRVLGRHFMPLLPVVLLVLGLGLAARWSRGKWWSRAIVGGVVVLSLVSCLSFRLAARHEKDDYRDAAALANEALQAGKTVWWNAGKEGAIYYHVALTEGHEKSAAVWLMNPTAETIAGLAAPELVVVSKPDVFDGRGACADFLRKGDYAKRVVLPAFTIWERGTTMRN